MPGLESSLRQTPLGVEINTATIWLLLQEGSGRGKEKGRKISTQTFVKTGGEQNTMIHMYRKAALYSRYDITVCSTAAEENP